MTPPAHPSSRPSPAAVVSLILGHIGVGAGVVALEILLGIDGAAHLGDPNHDTAHETLGGLALAAVLVGQLLSIRELLRHRHGHRHNHSPGHLEGRILAEGMRRLAWPISFAFYPILVGAPFFTLAPPPAPLLALFCALLPASLLLDHAHAGWTYRHLAGRGSGSQYLLTGHAARLRLGQHRTTTLLAVIAAVTLTLLAATAMTQPANTPIPTLLIRLLSPAGVAVLALLLIRPVLGVRRALNNDAVHLPTLDTAAHTLRRLGVAGALAAVLVVAAVLATPEDPWLAPAPIIPLVLVLGTAAMQLGSTTCINLGDTERRRGWGGQRTRAGNTYPAAGPGPPTTPTPPPSATTSPTGTVGALLAGPRAVRPRSAGARAGDRFRRPGRAARPGTAPSTPAG